MSTGQIITPDSNDAAFEQLDALAQPVVLQIPIGDGLFKTEVLGGLTKVQVVAAELLAGILSNPAYAPEGHTTVDTQSIIAKIETALIYADTLIKRSEVFSSEASEKESALESSEAS